MKWQVEVEDLLLQPTKMHEMKIVKHLLNASELNIMFEVIDLIIHEDKVEIIYTNK